MTYHTGERAFAYGFINPNTYNNNMFVYSLVLVVLVLIFGAFSMGLVKFKKYIDQIYHSSENQ